jgi:hypothetical protein
MPTYIVRAIKREVVELGADIMIEAESAESARATVIGLGQREEIDDRLWLEQDSWDSNEPIEIKEVWLKGSV